MTDPEPPPAPAPSPRAEFRPGDQVIDITVEVAADPLNDTLFWVKVTSPHLPKLDNAPPELWPLTKPATDLVAEVMRELTAGRLEAGQLRGRILSLGYKLFAKAPQSFRDVYWRLIDDDKLPSPSTILVQTEEWAIPWELMVPFRHRPGDLGSAQAPLGFQLRLGRWLTDDGIAPEQHVELDDSYVFAPRYPRRLRLRYADEELKAVFKTVPGERVRRGRRDALDAALAAHGVSLLHFVCHGEIRAPPVQAIVLEDDGRLLSVELPGMDGLVQALRAKPPMVFLNACEVGRQAPSLVGVGGFAMEFIGLGARCVVAPLWTVDDGVAFEVARTFYERIKDPTVVFADVMSEIRLRSFAEDLDTYAAYAFYGDPLCCRADLQ